VSINSRALAGYLRTNGLDKYTSDLLAKRYAENRFDDSMNFDNMIFQYKPLIGKKEAMHFAATSCLSVIGRSEYPLDQVKGLVACLAKGFDSIDSVLQCEHFESEPMSDLLSKDGVRETLNAQFYKSQNHRGGLLGLFS
jgi:hypothetical protein